MHEADAGSAPDNYNFTLAGSADEILGKIIQGEFDIAAVPTNVASVLYNKTEGAVQLAALNTLGVLYCVEIGDTVHSIEDLAGKTVYNLGKRLHAGVCAQFPAGRAWTGSGNGFNGRIPLRGIGSGGADGQWRGHNRAAGRSRL